MKPESKKIIENLIITMKLNNESEFTVSELERVLRIEMPTTSTKFDMWKYVTPKSEENLRPIMCCIHHQEGCKVASDSHILIVNEQEYDAELEGKNINRAGEFVEGRYPNFKSLNTGLWSEPYRVDLDKFYGMYHEYKATKKTAEYERKNSVVVINGVTFDMDRFKLLADYMKHIGTNELQFSGDMPQHRAVKTTSGNNWGLIMPQMPLECEPVYQL